MYTAILIFFIFHGLLPAAIALPSNILVRQATQATVDPNGLPTNWTLLGCYTDSNPAARTLQQASFTNQQMTPLLCTQLCSGSDGAPLYNFAATEYSQECYCDFNVQSGAEKLDDSACTFPCAGDANQTCGGASKISLYQNMNIGVPPVPTNKPSVAGGWSFLGCFSDALNGSPRTLDIRLDIPAGVTAESCTAQCASAGYTTAGLEFAQECWCGDDFDETTRAPINACSSTCKADHTELCGAANYLSIYTQSAPVESGSTTASPTVTPTSTKASTTTNAPTVTSPSTTAAPTTSIPTTTATPTITTKPTTATVPSTGTTATATVPTVTIPITIPSIIPTVTSIISTLTKGLPCVTCIGL